ncbi:MAG: polysaccharide biosynthesis tyrosine autokinase, partial [Candidatus Electrothrix sp. ATG2]|nr:polysaccharide biosynthesis tyrosine autokinase [Candidatus Electrothrix sp. ATG2]
LLQETMIEYEKKLEIFPVKSEKLNKLELVLTVSQEIYENFLNYLNKVQLAEAVALSDTRIIELAKTPEDHDFPKKTSMYLAGIFLGLFWGAMTAFFFEYIDTTIRSSEDIRHLEQINLLGTVPKSRHLRSQRLLGRHQRTAIFFEYYRTIRHNLRFSSPTEDITTFLVTSSGDKEGKSSVAAHIALSFAKARKKVLLADLNLRRPAVHTYFSRSNKQGLAEVVRSEVTTLQDTVLTTTVSGLDILPVGNIEEDFEDIIESDKLRQLLQDLREHYDIVILDTPSLNETDDALIIGSMSDYLIYTVECGRTQRADVEHAYSRFQQAGINRVGCVVNKTCNNKNKMMRYGASFKYLGV